MLGRRLRSKSPAQAWWSISAIRSSNRTSAASARCGAGLTSCLLIALATLGAVKHHPHRQVVGEVLESVTRARRREPHVVGGETVAPFLARFSAPFPYDEPAFASRDHIDLVAGVR